MTTPANVAPALAAWLAALSVAPADLDFATASDNCVSLCAVFSLFAPHLLTERDYFIPAKVSGANASRQRRYNTRRLARSLADWFQVRSRAASPVAGAVEVVEEPVDLSDDARERIRDITDAARAEEFDSGTVLLALAECLLCAAVHSHMRDTFINAILTLDMSYQDALYQSIRRTMADGSSANAVLSPVRLADENAMPASDSKARKVAPADAAPYKTDQNHADLLAAPRGIPPAEYKALAAERDALRRKVAAFENDRHHASDSSDALRRSLDEAGDRIRELQAVVSEKDEDIAAKTKALAETRTALRDAHVTAEDVDVLKAKAASAEQLEASLKRASKRLEEVADMRKANKELVAQMVAYKENEERQNKHALFIESKLAGSNDRAVQLASVSENLSAELEQKNASLSALSVENLELTKKLRMANEQLASMLMGNSSSTPFGATDSSVRAAPIATKGRSVTDDLENVNEAEEFTSPVVQTLAPVVGSEDNSFHPQMPVFSPEQVSDQLFRDIGVSMSWADIVDCIRGVVDAMNEMDEAERAEQALMMHGNSADAGTGDERSTHKRHRESPSSNPADDASESQSRGDSVFPAFAEVDSKMEAAHEAEHGDAGDEFDFAANQVNVTVIPVVPRRSSQRLATVPENREGFEAEASDHSDYYHEDGDESSFSSEYSSGSEHETDNPGAGSTDPVPQTTTQTTNQKAPELEELNVADNPTSSFKHDSLSSTESERGMTTDNLSMPYLQNVTLRGARVVSPATSLRDIVSHASSRGTSSESGGGSVARRVQSGVSLSPSYSDTTTRALMRQARSELAGMQNAMDMMRMERESSASIGVLVQQLTDAREELRLAQIAANDKEIENTDLRREMSVLIKEYDSLMIQNENAENRDIEVLQEKERTILILQKNLDASDTALATARREVAELHKENSSLVDIKMRLSEKEREHELVSRAQDVEIARLISKVEAAETIANKLGAAVENNNGLNEQINSAREEYYIDIAAQAKRDKELAEGARDEARRVAESQISVLQDVRATAAAAALIRPCGNDMMRNRRRSQSIRSFWRRLMNRDASSVDFSMPPSTLSNRGVSRNKVLSSL